MCGAVRLLPFLLIWMLLFLFHVSAMCGNRVQSEDKKKKKQRLPFDETSVQLGAAMFNYAIQLIWQSKWL